MRSLPPKKPRCPSNSTTPSRTPMSSPCTWRPSRSTSVSALTATERPRQKTATHPDRTCCDIASSTVKGLADAGPFAGDRYYYGIRRLHDEVARGGTGGASHRRVRHTRIRRHHRLHRREHHTEEQTHPGFRSGHGSPR